MRGFPPIQILLLCLTFGALAVPLSHLTGENSHAKVKSSPSPEAASSVKALLRLRFAHQPTSLSLRVADQQDITEIAASPLEADVTLPALEHGVDVFVIATWPEGTPDTAVTLEIEPEGLEMRSETRWSSAGGLDEVITFTWE